MVIFIVLFTQSVYKKKQMQNKIVFFIIALILFIIPVLDMYLWISISMKPMNTFQQSKAEYLSHYPEILQNALISTLLNILFLAAASILFYKARTGKGLKKLSLVFFYICIILISWQVFSLM